MKYAFKLVNFNVLSAFIYFTNRVLMDATVTSCLYHKGIAEKTHHFTLLDGEMIIDTMPDSQKQERRYLIYDMMALNSVSIIEV